MDTITVEYRVGFMRGCVMFSTLGEALGFIFNINRQEQFDPRGNFARIVW